MNAATLMPKPIDDATHAFPADVLDLLPPYGEIPKEFSMYNGSSPWVKVTEDWFHKGLRGSLVPKDGIDAAVAGRHISAIMRSFQPKHEHKIAGVAYLMSLWFERFEPTS